jgi:hypothetical protein
LHRKVNQFNLDSVLESVRVRKERLQEVYKNTEYNKTISRYYQRLHAETQSSSMFNKIEYVLLCNTCIEIDRYEAAKVKDYKRTNLCRDKFCSNCKKVLQAARMNKYIPILNEYKDCLYHLTLTQPNCSSDELPNVIKKMSKKFRHLIQIIRGEIKIKDLDFTKWGYLGAVRSLEITFKNNSYHPHYHIALAIDHDTTLDNKHIKLCYSRSRKFADRLKLFSEEEILIQKLWRLLMNDIPVTKKAIDNLEIGYSCSVDKFKDSDYAELFKYLTKSTNEFNTLLTYNNFKTLCFALYRVKQIQAYGVFYNKVDDKVSDEDIEAVESIYDKIIELLQKAESPIAEINTLADLIQNFHQYKLISRKSIKKYLDTLLE